MDCGAVSEAFSFVINCILKPVWAVSNFIDFEGFFTQPTYFE